MATTKITRYHGRLNTAVTPNRKEWRRVGRNALVVAGGTVTPGSTLAISLVASPSDPVVGQTVTLTATTTGGLGPYVRTFSQVSGAAVTLSGTGGTTRTFVPNTSGSRSFRVRVVDDEGTTQEAVVSVTTAGAALGDPLYAGHIPGRVLIGYASNASTAAPGPEFYEARTIVQERYQALFGVRGPGGYEWRIFDGVQTRGNDISTLRSMLAKTDAAGVYGWISCKVTGNDWAGVAAGNYPGIVTMWRQLAAERRAAGKPFAATMHHEPRGDAPAGQTIADWAAMHVYMSNQLAADNDIMAWSAIGNGFLWNQVNPTGGILTDRNNTYPQELITTLRVNKHIAAVDIYDEHPDYTGQETPPAGSFGVRASVKLSNWISYMRQRNCGALGIGEWSTTDNVETAKVWGVMKANRDILGVTNYYNSIQGGSTWDWRMVPASYPVRGGTTAMTDYGGTALTDGRLTEYCKLLNESTSPTATGPL